MGSENKLNNRKFFVNNVEITNLEYIGHGASAEVFKGKYGEEWVAVKAMRENSGEAFKTDFLEEAKILQALGDSWEKNYSGEEQITPEYYGGEFNSETPYIVEEFIDGKTINQAIHLMSASVFNEDQAVSLMIKICKLFKILHEDLKKSYGDIKFDNFLIVGDPSEPKIKIIDWNVLGDYSEEKVKGELLYLATYLYYMLTGKSIVIKENKISEFNSNDLDKNTDLSYAAVEFLKTVLNRNPEQRLNSVSDWLEKLETIHKIWNINEEDFDLEFKDLSFDDMTPQELAEKKKSMSIGEKRGFSQAKSLMERIEDYLGESKFIEKIKKSLESDSAEQADTYFVNYQKTHTYLGDEIILWGYLAALAKGLGPKFFNRREDLYALIGYRVDLDWENFYQVYRSIKSNPSFGEEDILANLKLEFTLQKRIQNYFESGTNVEEFKIIHQEYEKLPDLLKLLIDKKINIKQEIDNIELIRKKQENAEHDFKFCKENNDIDGMIFALSKMPDKKDIRNDLQKTIEEKLREGVGEEAVKYIRLAIKAGIADDWFEEALYASFELIDLKRIIKYGFSGNYLQIEKVLNYYERNKDKDHCFLEGVEKFLLEVFDYFLSQNRFQEAKDLLEEILKIRFPDHEINTFKQKIDEEEKNYISETLKKINAKLKSGFHSEEEIQCVKDLIKEFNEKYSNNSEQKDKIISLINDLKIKEEEYKKNQELKEKNDVEIKKIRTSIDLLQEEINIFQRLLKKENDLELSKHLNFQLGADLVKISRLIEQLAIFQGETDEIKELRDWLKNKISINNLEGIHTCIKEAITSQYEGIIDQYQEAVNSGHLINLQVVKQYLPEDIIPSLEKIDKNIHGFITWVQGLSEWNDNPLPWIENGIPEVYWTTQFEHRKSTQSYFEEKFDRLINTFSLDNLPELVLASWIKNIGKEKVSTVNSDDVWQAAFALNEFEEQEWNDRNKKGEKDFLKKDKLVKNIKDNLDHYPNWKLEEKPELESSETNEGFIKRFLNSIKKIKCKPCLIGGGAVLLIFVVGGIYLMNQFLPIGAGKETVVPTDNIDYQKTVQFLGQELTDLQATNAYLANPPTPLPTEETATPTPTQTPIPDSSYFLGAYYQNLPELPLMLGEPIYILDDDQSAVFSPDENSPWKPLNGLSMGVNNSFHYVELVEGFYEAGVTWEMDQPIKEEGRYEIYISDPKNNSGTTDSIQYTVFINDIEAAPITGSNSIRLLKQTEQDGDTWISIGVYVFQIGDRIKIVMNCDPSQLGDGSMVGADAVLISKLPDINRDAIQNLEDEKEDVLFVLDQDQLQKNPQDGWLENENDNLWNGTSSSIFNNSGIEMTVTTKWEFALPQGDYKFKLFIPENNTSDFNVKIMIDGQEEVLETSTILHENISSGTYYPQSGWLINIPEYIQNSKPGIVTFEITANLQSNQTFEIDNLIVIIDTFENNPE